MSSGCPWKGRSWATIGCTIFGGASLSLPGQVGGVHGAKKGTAGEGLDHYRVTA